MTEIGTFTEFKNKMITRSEFEVQKKGMYLKFRNKV